MAGRCLFTCYFKANKQIKDLALTSDVELAHNIGLTRAINMTSLTILFQNCKSGT